MKYAFCVNVEVSMIHEFSIFIASDFIYLWLHTDVSTCMEKHYGSSPYIGYS